MTFTANQLQDAFAVATQYIHNMIPDVMTASCPFLNIMMKDQNLEFVAGGTNIQWPVNHLELLSQGWIDGERDVLSTNPQQQFTYATLDWKFKYWAMGVTMRDITITHDSPEAVASLLVAKVKAAKASVQRDLASAIHTSGSASNRQWNGLPDVVAASGTAYAGLTDTDFTDGAWLADIDASSQNPNYATIGAMSARLSEKIENLGKNQETDFRLDMMLSRARVLQKFKNTYDIRVRMQNQETLRAGFKGVEVDGMEWYADSNCPGTANTADNYLYMFPTKAFKLFYKYGFGGRKSPLDTSQIVPNQPVKLDINYMAGNLACLDRRLVGVFTAMNA